jgi:hypothetical protein
MSSISPSAGHRKEELARKVSPSKIHARVRLIFGGTFRKLDAVSGQLKRLGVDSLLGSADVAQDNNNFFREIDDHMSDFMVSRPMQNDIIIIQRLLEVFSDNQGQFPSSVHQKIVFVMDAGREHQLLVKHCRSREVSHVD